MNTNGVKWLDGSVDAIEVLNFRLHFRSHVNMMGSTENKLGDFVRPRLGIIIKWPLVFTSTVSMKFNIINYHFFVSWLICVQFYFIFGTFLKVASLFC